MTDTNDAWPGGAPRVGQKAELTRAVATSDIEMFTAISGDRNPLHYDEALATSAILNAVVAEKLPGPGTVFLRVDGHFKAPVRSGDACPEAVGEPRRAYQLT